MCKVNIGCKYTRPWFEERTRDGAYSAFKAPMWPESIDLQKQLIGPGLQPHRDLGFWGRWTAYGAALILALCSAAMALA